MFTGRKEECLLVTKGGGMLKEGRRDVEGREERRVTKPLLFSREGGSIFYYFFIISSVSLLLQ